MSLPNSRIRFVVGIDEAGRGPLAGPVAVGAVVVATEALTNINGNRSVHPLFKVAKDSKQLSPPRREEIFKFIQAAKKDGTLDFAVSLVSAKVIDEKGIVFAIRRAIKNCLNKLGVPPHQTLILLDGSLHAPEQFLFQETIIRGDQSEPIIGLASIAAKVTRDQKMLQLAKKYPQFGFEIHKGYGTLFHRKQIKKYGASEIHRKSFLRG
jgi:ribonuclease HII